LGFFFTLRSFAFGPRIRFAVAFTSPSNGGLLALGTRPSTLLAPGFHLLREPLDRARLPALLHLARERVAGI
jgi:hypothetical protein